MMQTLIGLMRVLLLLTLLGVMYSQAGFAQSARKFTNKPMTVRLCPGTCRAVNGHGLKPGGKVSVFESRGGWARVSAYLDRAALVPSFGNKITKKPALWVPVASLVANKPAAKPVAKKTKTVAPKKKRQATKRVSVIDRIARLQRVPSPVFRPGNGNNQPVQAAVSEPVTTTATKVAVSEPAANPEPVKKPVVVDTTPVTSITKGSDSQKTLSWEEVQAKIAAQAAGKSTSAAPAAPAKPTEAEKAKQAEAAAAAQAAEAAKAKQAEAAAAAQAAEAAKAKQAEAAAAAQAAEAAKAKQAEAAAAAQAAEAAKAKQVEAAAAAQAAEAAKAKQAEAAAAAQAAEAAKAKQAEAAAAAQAAEAAKAKQAAEDTARVAAETKRKLEEQAKAAEAAKQTENAKVAAVVLPPKKVEPAVVKAPEPTFKSAKADPIALGARPKKMTKKLLDKRLKKLPGSKSKTPKKVVIALRHYALGLLDSGECKGIERGGASAVPGMLFVTCSDDPTYLRQFPLEEETW